MRNTKLVMAEFCFEHFEACQAVDLVSEELAVIPEKNWRTADPSVGEVRKGSSEFDAPNEGFKIWLTEFMSQDDGNLASRWNDLAYEGDKIYQEIVTTMVPEFLARYKKLPPQEEMAVRETKSMGFVLIDTEPTPPKFLGFFSLDDVAVMVQAMQLIEKENSLQEKQKKAREDALLGISSGKVAAK